MALHNSIQLIAVGDICPGDHFSMGFGTGTLVRKYGPTFPFEKVAAILRDGDIVFGNCEGVISDVGANPKDIDAMQFRGVLSFAQALRQSGFTVINVANNHSGEHGLAAFHDTVRNLENAGLKVVGLRGAQQTSQVLIQDIKGLRLGWLSYTWITSRNAEADWKSLSCPKEDEVSSEVASLSSEVDFVIVSAHWGNEFVQVPPKSIIDWAHAIADAGADLIIGHHPHVIQGLERRGKCQIAYSLGNFVFDMWQPSLRETALFRCKIRDGEVCDPEFLPLKLNRSFQPTPATARSSNRIRRRIEFSSRAITDPNLDRFRDDKRAAKIEAKFKKKLTYWQVPYLAFSLGRMGPSIAYQKLCRRLPFLSPRSLAKKR